MRKYPDLTNDYDLAELEDLKAEDWMVECLKMNPSYCGWGNFEDYMMEGSGQWSKPWNAPTVQEGLIELDDLNECVNFYFQVTRRNKPCTACEGTCYNPATKQLYDDWYDFAGTGRRWCDKITQDEVVELVKQGRLTELTDRRYSYDGLWHYWDREAKEQKLLEGEPNFPTAEKVNAWAQKGMGHDAINCWICVETRARRLGVWGPCEVCRGRGKVYLEPKAHLSLQLWILHPRKGCSRGIYIERVEKEDLPRVTEFLQEAARRNQARFSRVSPEVAGG